MLLGRGIELAPQHAATRTRRPARSWPPLVVSAETMRAHRFGATAAQSLCGGDARISRRLARSRLVAASSGRGNEVQDEVGTFVGECEVTTLPACGPSREMARDW